MLDILIVEDNIEIATLLCDFLRKENYTVSIASTGEKAMDIYEKYCAKLILCFQVWMDLQFVLKLEKVLTHIF